MREANEDGEVDYITIARLKTSAQVMRRVGQ